MKIALSPSLHDEIGRRIRAERLNPTPMDVTIILKSDTEPFLRDNWRILSPVQVSTVEEAKSLLLQLEEMESLE